MYLKTKINVTVPVTAGGALTGKLKATLNNNPLGVETNTEGGFSASIDYKVLIPTSMDVEVPVEGGEEGETEVVQQMVDVEHEVLRANRGRVKITEAVFQAIYDSVEASLPSDSQMHLRLVTLGYKVVEAKMIEEFSELTSDADFELVP